MSFKVKDYVTTKDDQRIYMIEKLDEKTVYLKGLTYRYKIVTTIDNITKASIDDVNKVLEKFKATKPRSKNRMLYGTILHIDGDEEYLNSCMDLYKQMNVFANGIYIKEENIKDEIEKLVLDLTPDIVVITGHDLYNGKGIKDLDNYTNTKHYMEAVRRLRKHFSLDSVVVIVGACGSHFEALIASGANFSSSPKRINIHTYDPAIIAIKVATTSINQMVDFNQTLKYIENKKDSFGGIETKGKMKILL